MGKNLKVETKGKSFLYIFYEKDTDFKFIKIGIVSHAVTDEHIKNWPDYSSSKHPVSIQRRIFKLQTGNPRKIEPLAYFMYDTKKEASSVERKLHKHFSDQKIKNISSKEWFYLTKEDTNAIISALKLGSADKIPGCIQTEHHWNETVIL